MFCIDLDVFRSEDTGMRTRTICLHRLDNSSGGAVAFLISPIKFAYWNKLWSAAALRHFSKPVAKHIARRSNWLIWNKNNLWRHKTMKQRCSNSFPAKSTSMPHFEANSDLQEQLYKWYYIYYCYHLDYTRCVQWGYTAPVASTIQSPTLTKQVCK